MLLDLLNSVGALVGIVAAILSIFAAIAQFRAGKAGDKASDDLAKPRENENNNLEVPSSKYGVFHRSVEKRSNTLIIFVHGILGDAATTWKQFPFLVRDSLQGESGADIFRYAYPSRLLEKADISAAASDLSVVLSGLLSSYENIVFVNHSTGGLVVKKTLIDEMTKAREWFKKHRFNRYRPDQAAIFRKHPALRVRSVVDIAVPHSGGTLVVSSLLIALYTVLVPFLFLTMPVIMALSRIPRYGVRFKLAEGSSFGLNRIVYQLRWNSRSLIEWEKRYTELRLEFDRMRWSRPISYQIASNVDAFVNPHEVNDVFSTGDEPFRKSESGVNRMILRGTHSGVKDASNVFDPAVDAIANTVRPFLDSEELRISHDVYLRCMAVDWDDRPIGSSRMIKPDHWEWKESGEGSRKFEGAAIQNQALRELHQVVWRQSHGPRCTLIHGAAGTGKSFVLRMFARGLVLKRMNLGVGTLPLLIPCQQIQLDERKIGAAVAAVLDKQDRNAEESFPTRSRAIGKALWQGLLEVFTIQANRFVASLQLVSSDADAEDFNDSNPTPPLAGGASRPYTVEQFERLLHDQKMVLILDSLDEFSMKHPWATGDGIRAMIQYCIDTFTGSPNAPFTLVLGLRSAEPIFADLSPMAQAYVEVARLERPEAIEHFNGVGPLLDLVPECNKEAETILLTPLVLAALQGFRNEGRPTKLKNRAAVLDLALRAILTKSQLPGMSGELEGPVQLPEWVDMLTLLSTEFSISGGGEFMPSDVIKQLERLEKSWLPKFAQSPEFRRISRAKERLRDKRLVELLMQRSVFFPLDLTTYRFQHREWQDYLWGLYFTPCIKAVNLAELTRSAFTLSAFATGGQVLNADPAFEGIDLAFVQRAIPQFDSPLGQLVIGNLGGLLGNSGIKIGADARSELASYFGSQERRTGCHGADDPRPFTRAGDLVFFGGLGYRTLSRPGVRHLEMLRNVLKCVDPVPEWLKTVPMLRKALFDGSLHRELETLKQKNDRKAQEPEAAEVGMEFSERLEYLREELREIRFQFEDQDRLRLFSTPLLQDNLKRAETTSGAAHGLDLLIASQAWCLLKTYSWEFKSSMTLPPWRELSLSTNQELEILDRQFVDLAASDDERMKSVYRSIQMAHVSNQRSVLESPFLRPPVIVHYLFGLTLAVKHGVASGQIPGLLKNLVQNERVRTIYQNHEFPEVRKIFDQCRSNL